MYSANPDLVGLVTANDGMAGGVIARQKAAGVEGEIPVTGQDATAEGLPSPPGLPVRHRLQGHSLEAKAAADLAIAIINGDDTSSIRTGVVNDSELGVDVPSVLADPVWITADNVQSVIDAARPTLPRSAPASRTSAPSPASADLVAVA